MASTYFGFGFKQIKKMNQDKLSIITICYNRVSDISLTLQSVANQSYKEIQYIVIDGASTDGTLDVLKLYDSKISNLVNERDKGIYNAMNKGLSLATGDYVLFINGGDQLYDDQTIQKVFEHSNGEDILYGECMFIDENGTHLGLRTELTNRPLPETINKNTFLYGSNISHQSFIAKRKIIGQFQEDDFKIVADLDWMIKAMNASKSYKKLNFPISKFLAGGTSTSHWKKAMNERFKLYVRHYGLLKTILAHLVIAQKSVFKKIGLR